MTTSFGLLRAIDSAAPLTEILSFLNRGKPAPAATPPVQDEEDDDVSDNVSLLHQFADSVKGAPSGSDRYALRMSTSDLKDHYLKPGGGKSFVDSLDDKTISSFINLQPRVQFLNNYDFKKLMSKDPRHDAVVLLDVPHEITSKLKTAWSGPGDINAIRDALRRMMNHRYYVMTLSSSRVKKLADKVAPHWNDLDELSEVLDPSVAIAYPSTSDHASLKTAFLQKLAERKDKQSSADAEQEEKDTKAKAKKDEEEQERAKNAPPEPTPEKPEDAPLTGKEKVTKISPKAQADLARRALIQLKDTLTASGHSDEEITKLLTTLNAIKNAD